MTKPPREVDSVHFTLTTLCNMRCQWCAQRIPQRVGKHYNLAYIAQAAEVFHGLELLTITGGEPTLHPLFAELAPRFRPMFGCRRLVVESNGYGFRKFPEAFDAFDSVHASHYTAATFPGAPDNTADVQFLVDYYHADRSNLVQVGEMQHVPTHLRPGSGVCERGQYPIAAYFDGRLYPCCVGPGVEGAESIVPTKDWRTEILDVPLACGNCWFGE